MLEQPHLRIIVNPTGIMVWIEPGSLNNSQGHPLI